MSLTFGEFVQHWRNNDLKKECAIGKRASETITIHESMHPVLAGFLLKWRKQPSYSKDDDWIFPSLKLKGAKPGSASIAAQDDLRPAAVYAGVIEVGSSKLFGWHNLRHSLAEFLAG